MATLQAERVKEAAKVKAAKEAKLTEKNGAMAEKTVEGVEGKATAYNNDHLVQLVSAILAADKTRLLDYPTAIAKAKQVLDAINRL